MSSQERGGSPIPAGHIGWPEAVAMLVIVTVIKAFEFLPSRLASQAQTAAWTVPIFSGILSVPWLWALVSVLKANPGKDIVSITRSEFGPFVAFLFGAACFAFNIGITATVVRESTDAVGAVLLPLTPEMFFIALQLTVALYIALKGPEIVGRVSIPVCFAAIGLLALLATLSIGMWVRDSIFPLLGPGIPQLLKTYFVRQSVYTELLSLGLLAPYLRRPDDVGKVAARSMALAIAAITVAVLVCQMVFPYPSLTRVIEPLLRVSRILSLGRFLQRTDALLAPAWIITGHMHIAISILVGSLTLASTLNIKALGLPTVFTAAAVLGLTFLIPDMSTGIVVGFDILRPYSVVLLNVWPIALWAATRFRSRAKRQRR